MNKYKVILETYVEAEEVLSALYKAHHKLERLSDTQFLCEVIDVHEYTNEGWKSSSGIVDILERIYS